MSIKERSMNAAFGRIRSFGAVLAVAAIVVGGCSAKRGDGVKAASTRSALTAGNGLIPNGLTTNGIWTNGIWTNGIWTNGIWTNGIWTNGIWTNGIWTNGIWTNGIWTNGTSTNGIWTNGIWTNGIWTNGIWTNGLTGPAKVPGETLRHSVYARQLIQYVYSCAMPGPTYNSNGEVTSSYNTTLDPNLDINGQGGLPCSTTNGDPSCDEPGYACVAGKCVIPLNGAIGLGINDDYTTWWGQPAPGGAPAGTPGKWGQCDESCQRWVSACVLARTNAYGVHVEISMRAPHNAPDAIKNALATSENVNGNKETDVFWQREGAYYGNIFETKPVSPAPTDGSEAATGAIAGAPIYTACAGPESNVPQLTKRFESSQGDQLVIGVPGVCLATGSEDGACAGSDPDSTSSTYRSIQHCYTMTMPASAMGDKCAKKAGPLGGLQPYDPTCYDEVITVFLAQPIAVCGNGICEPPNETTTCCPTDCHPSTWAKDFSPLLKTGDPYVAPACTEAQSLGGTCDASPPVKFSPSGMSALADDSSVAVVGNASDPICTECPLSIGNANLPPGSGVGVLVKYTAEGKFAWPPPPPGELQTSAHENAIRFGANPPVSYVYPLQSVSGVVVGTNATSPPSSPDHTGNITVAGVTTQVNTSVQELWVSSFGPDGSPLGTWIPQLLGGPTLTPYGGTLAFDSQSNLVLALDATNLQVQPTSITGGGNSSCALLSGGAVECWGQDGATLATSPTPVVIPGITGATALTTMSYATCALLKDGTVKCWGDNSEGELGNGTTIKSQAPVTVSGLSGVTALSSSGFTACALLSSGTVQCWGSNAFGQLGNGTNTGPQLCSLDPSDACSMAPVTVMLTNAPTPTPLTGVTAISVGQYSVCAIVGGSSSSGGPVYCWGSNDNGLLGNGGAPSFSANPVATNLTGVKQISVGLYSACALIADGTVQCWGDNSEGELGIGSSNGPQTCAGQACATTPVTVQGLHTDSDPTHFVPVTQISVGVYFGCALLADATVKCWGDNAYGSLGTGSTTSTNTCKNGSPCSLSPVTVQGLTGVKSLASSGSSLNTCATLTNGITFCWGDNYYSSLGNGMATGPQVCASGSACSTTPVAVSAPAYYAQTNTLVLKTSLPPVSGDAPVVWVAPLGGAKFPQSLSVDQNDNVIVVSSDAVSDVPVGTLQKICSDGATGSTCPDGSTAWTSNVPYLTAAAIQPGTGNIFAAGVAYSASGHFGVPYVRKFDTDGANLWAEETTDNSSTGQCPYMGSDVASSCMSQPAVQGVKIGFDGGNNVIIASFGNPAIGGGINFGMSVDPPLPTFPTYGSPNIFLSAYEPGHGAPLWAKQIQTILSGSLHGFALGNQGQVIVAGNYSGSMQVDGQLLVTAAPALPSVVDSFLASFAEPTLTALPPPEVGSTSGTCGGAAFQTVPSKIYVSATSPAGACVFYLPPTSAWATTVSCSQPPNTTFPIGETDVTCTAYDAYGQSATTPPFKIIVADPPPPSLSNVPEDINQTVAGPTEIDFTPPTVVDQLYNPDSCSACGGPSSGTPTPCVPPTTYADCTPPPGTTFPLGQTTVSCTTTDVRGRTASASFTVKLTAQVTASCVGAPGSPVTIPTPSGQCGVAVDNASAVAGSCAGAGLATCTFDGQAAETLGPGTYAIPVVAIGTDASTTSTCTSYVTVADNEKPGLACAAAQTECAGGGGATVTPTASCTDNCGSCTKNCTTGFFPVGTSPGSCTAKDTAGNTSSCQPDVTVVDTKAPVVTLRSGPSQLQCHVDTWTDPGATAVDQCVGDLSGGIHATGIVDPMHVGSYTETYSVSDPSGNPGSATRIVSVVDTNAPVVTPRSGPSQLQCHVDTWNDPGATAVDQCAGDLSGGVHATGIVDPMHVGSYTETYSVSDPSGNAGSATRTVSVVDTKAPVVTPRSGPSQLQCHVDTWSDPGATAVDQCAGDLSSSVHATGAVDPTHVGSYTETYSVSDPSGNAGSATRTVSVVDTLAPTTSATVGANPGANTTITVKITSYSITPKGGGTPVTGSATCWSSSGLTVALKAVDACSIKQITYALSGAQTGGATVTGGLANVNLTTAGTTTLSYYATDSAGNQEIAHTLPLFLGSSTGGQKFSCSPAPQNLPAHGTVTAQGTITITNSKTGKTTTESFNFTQSY
jgi:alpha-tubulin suppressor-like RCC1 family protein